MKIKMFLSKKEKSKLALKDLRKDDFDFEAKVENVRISKSSINSGYMAPALLNQMYISCKMTLLKDAQLTAERPSYAYMKFLNPISVINSLSVGKEFYLVEGDRNTVKVRVTKILYDVLAENYNPLNDKMLLDSNYLQGLFISIKDIIYQWDPFDLIKSKESLVHYDTLVGLIIDDIKNDKTDNLAFLLYKLFSIYHGYKVKKSYYQCRKVALKIAKLLNT